jgi:hypothetical protein
MAVTTAQTTDVAKVLATVLESVPGLRTSWFVNDSARPPVAVVMQPDIDFSDSSGGFCTSVWTWPVTLIVSRSNDRESQVDLGRLVCDVANALNDAQPEGVFSIEPLTARPITVSLNGQDLPAYQLSVLIRA